MKREIMRTWYEQVIQFMKRFNITECWQVMNADETMLDTTLASKYTWTSGKTYVKVNGSSLFLASFDTVVVLGDQPVDRLKFQVKAII